jgi:hypothetical protein
MLAATRISLLSFQLDDLFCEKDDREDGSVPHYNLCDTIPQRRLFMKTSAYTRCLLLLASTNEPTSVPTAHAA